MDFDSEPELDLDQAFDLSHCRIFVLLWRCLP
jgi:hypothetical protein